MGKGEVYIRNCPYPYPCFFSMQPMFLPIPEDTRLPPEFWQGIAQFNRGEFYACHDTLEAIWMTASIPEKPFFQGILQLAVALYHLSNHNWQGAAMLMGEGMRRLEPFEPHYGGIQVSDLLDRASAWQRALQVLGPEQVVQLALMLEKALPKDYGSPKDEALTISLPNSHETLPMWMIQTTEAS